MLDLDENDIVRRCGRSAAEAGRRYHRQARVVEFAREGDAIRSAVKGSQKRPYTQTIRLSERRGGGTDVDGRCTCPVGANCKHVAAALFHAVTVASAARAAEARDPEFRFRRLAASGAEAPAVTAGASTAEPDLPFGLAAWIDDFARAADASGEDYPDDVAQRLVYVLMPVRDDPRMPQLGVRPVSARLLKGGTFSAQSRPVAAGNATPGGPKYFRPSDGRIMRELARQPPVPAMSLYRLADDAGAEVLARILATGRARWLALDGPALAAGPARPGSLSWAEAGPATLLPRLTLDGEGTALAATPPVYVNAAAGLVGPVETGRPARVAAALFRAPPVAATALRALNERLSHRAPALLGLAPPTPASERPCSCRSRTAACWRCRWRGSDPWSRPCANSPSGSTAPSARCDCHGSTRRASRRSRPRPPARSCSGAAARRSATSAAS